MDDYWGRGWHQPVQKRRINSQLEQLQIKAMDKKRDPCLSASKVPSIFWLEY
ncbi:hypothetical protein J18TS1_13530 [Oceanobacillus oncorhynchi subsp. incaldanensis]|nr:hypothetical protein J18TS1_13530 [Oceanobacillus oncorhynchi subsp. incaldanensis]